MKKIFLSSWAFIWMCIMSWAQPYNFQHLIGKWEAVDGSGIEAIDSARLFLVYGADKKAIISFKADFTKSPCWFDFSVKNRDQRCI